LKVRSFKDLAPHPLRYLARLPPILTPAFLDAPQA
jgi:hypothetical protein